MTARIAIVGAGPSACFLAQALLKQREDLRIDLIDRLPVPYGLVRYGVAADHQGTKAVTRQFARLFERQGVRFFGNVCVGEDVTLAQLRKAYGAVVLAAGLSRDLPLGIPGDGLAGVYSAGSLTRALYEHPDAAPLPDLGPHPLIIGNGNVAIDLLRLLAKTPEELDGSDLGPVPTAWLAHSGIETLTIVGRSPAPQARFDTVMLRELARLSGVAIAMDEVGNSKDPETARKLETLRSLDGHGSGPRRIAFRFGLRPLRIEGEDRANAVRFARAGGEERLTCTSVLTAIGFAATGDLDRDGLLAGAVDAAAGILAPGLYATGWFRRGPRGTIPENRNDAQELAGRILEDLPAAGISADPAILLRGMDGTVLYDGWKRIDAHELAGAPAGRCRLKLPTRQDMLAIAREKEN